MPYISHYHSPIGEILLAAEDTALTGLWFAGQLRVPRHLERDGEARDIPVLVRAKQWLDQYFSGQAPASTVPLHMTGTAFQLEVWDILRRIPYGQATTYGALARQIALRRGLPRMSAQAVGGAVGRNPISILVPCHRVIGADGSLTGYAGGMDKKRKLLRLEGIEIKEETSQHCVVQEGEKERV